ncbi:MAG TPA: tripartite tricarboxylate transporter substrate binding protein [Hyphomicrobiaceae bacterium]|jgi:tripartite-type tricarboxylate transporter receptor subunit TctC|nr:tripartite tricarboxylate transporter substrate binding protein [Hyphomicrobiaceae bacterium]
MRQRNLSRRQFGKAALGLSLLPRPAAAQKLSDRAITIVVPFTAGTGIDILARILGEELQQRWGQAVTIENRPGASGNIGSQYAATRAPDGHTIMMTVNTFVMNVSLFKSVPYDPQKSFAPIAEVATGALALAVHPSVAAPSAQALVALARANPGKITYASPGRGTPQHLAMELLKLTAQIDLVHVPYSGSAGAVRDLVGGHVGAMFIPLHTVLPLAREQQLRLLAVGSDVRSTLAPEVPTFAEEGLAGINIDLWYALLAPADTPPEIIGRYHQVVNDMLRTPKVRDALTQQGLTARGGSPADLAQLIANDLARWAKVVKDAKIAPTE